MAIATIDSDTITQVRIDEDLFTIGDGERRAPAPARRNVKRRQGRNG